ncbi:hypothetical protein THF5H11_20046 [Vibrio jasicida]|nr:hypothetical protein THF5H11_20046 [Vibrio jasicida]
MVDSINYNTSTLILVLLHIYWLNVFCMHWNAYIVIFIKYSNYNKRKKRGGQKPERYSG